MYYYNQGLKLTALNYYEICAITCSKIRVFDFILSTVSMYKS